MTKYLKKLAKMQKIKHNILCCFKHMLVFVYFYFGLLLLKTYLDNLFEISEKNGPRPK